MTPRTTKKRPSLFPAYAPPEHENPSLEEWGEHLGTYIQTLAKRVVQIGTLLVTIGGGAAYATHVGETQAPNEGLYVRRDSFAIYTANETATRVRDSLITDAKMARIDTALSALLRDCRRRGGCSP